MARIRKAFAMALVLAIVGFALILVINRIVNPDDFGGGGRNSELQQCLDHQAALGHDAEAAIAVCE